MTIRRGNRRLARTNGVTAAAAGPSPGSWSSAAVDRGPVTGAAGLTYEAVRGDHPDFALTPEQIEVDWFVDNVGWAGFYVQIKALLGSMCPWIPLHREGSEWVPIEDPNKAARHAGIIAAIRPPTRSQTGLRFRSLYLQAGVGEHAFWPVDVVGRGLTFDIAHPVQLARSPNSHELFAVKTRRDASANSGVGWNEFHRERLRRHWNPNPKWPDEATTALEPVRAELGLYRDTVMSMKRTAQSRLLMNGLLWISTNEEDEVGNPWATEDRAPSTDPGDLTPSTPETQAGLENLLREYSRFGARAYRDTAGNDVAAHLPFPFPHHTAPQHVDFGRRLEKKDLEALTEIVFAGARGLDVPTQYLVNGEASANAWNDAELRRALHERGVFPELTPHNEFWTDFGYRPLLALTRAGGLMLGDDDPNDYMLGCATDVLDIRSDSLQAIALALSQGIASREWAAAKLGVSQPEMLVVPPEIDDYEHWLNVKASASRAQAETSEDFPELTGALPSLPAGDPASGTDAPAGDPTPRDPEPGVAAGARALALIEGRGR